jgi:hypothetical protein
VISVSRHYPEFFSHFWNFRGRWKFQRWAGTVLMQQADNSQIRWTLTAFAFEFILIADAIEDGYRGLFRSGFFGRSAYSTVSPHQCQAETTESLHMRWISHYWLANFPDVFTTQI